MMASTPNAARTSVTAPTGTDQAAEPYTRLAHTALDWEVGDERVELTVGPGCV